MNTHCPVTHQITDRYGQVIRTETLDSEVPAGPGQLVDFFQLSTARLLAIARDGGMGDLLMLSPVLEQIHIEHPNLDITVYCKDLWRPLLQDVPGVTTLPLERYEEDRWKHDLFVDLRWFVERSVLKHKLDRTSLFAAAFGKTPRHGKPVYQVYAEEEYEALQWVAAQAGDKVRIALAPWSVDPRRSWPAEYALQLVRAISSMGGCPLVVHHSPQLRSVFADEDVVFVDSFSVRQTAAILAQCHTVVSVDTGIVHLAHAVQDQGRPDLLFIYGMWDPKLRLKWMKNYMVLSPDESVPCAPCNEGQPFGCGAKCMSAVTPATVWDLGLAGYFGGVGVDDVAGTLY